jgi:outer membrane lipoprotein SlyB
MAKSINLLKKPKNELLDVIENKKAEGMQSSLPKEDKKEEELPSNTSEVYRDKSGTLAGITTPEGKTYLGLSQKEVEQIAAAKNKKYQTPAGTVEARDVAQQRAIQEQQLIEMQQNQQIAGNIGQLSPQGELQYQRPDLVQAGAAGIRTAIPGAIGGAATGAVAGALAGGGTPLSIPFAIAGGDAGFTSSVLSNLKKQKTEDIASSKLVLTDANKMLPKIIALAKADKNPANREKYVDMFNLQLANIERAHSQLKLDTQKVPFKFEDATVELQKCDNFYAVGGGYDFYTTKMASVLLDPNADISDINTLMQYEEMNTEE